MKVRTRNRPYIRRAKTHTVRARHSKKTTRVTVDFPSDEHRRLKAMASLEGMTLQEYIRTHVMGKVEAALVQDSEFKRLVEKIFDEHEDVLKRLADK